MAQQSEVKTAETVNKGGRPKGSTDKAPRAKPAKTAPVFDYQRSRVTFQKAEDFYAYLAGYPDSKGLMGYVFRTKPKIDHSMIGISQTSIYQTTNKEELTEEFVADKFGRGEYMVILKDENRPKGQTEACRTWFKCPLAEKPPQYDPRTLLLSETSNLDEINRLLNLGVLVRDGANSAPRVRNTNDAPAPPPAAALPGSNGSGDVLGRDVIGQLLLALVNKGTANPADAVKSTIEMAKAIAPPPVDFEGMVERVVARLSRRNGNGQQDDDAFTTYERMDAFLSKFRPAVTGQVLTDAAPAASLSDPASWLPHLPGVFHELRGLIRDVGQEIRTSRQNGNGHAPQAQNGAGPQIGAPQPMTLDQRIEEIATLGFAQMGMGTKGWDFAAYVCHHHPGGLEVYRFLEPGGTAGVIGLCALNPAVRPILNDSERRAQLEAFLDDFFDFDASPEASGSAAAGAAANAPA
jgi:hypothetical protein